MMSVRIFCTGWLGLFLVFFRDVSECCSDTGSPAPKLNITHVNSDEQSLVMSWLVNHAASSSDIYEIQISRTEEHTVIYERNVRVYAGDSTEYTWTWTSDLPLECVDLSVRIRVFCNHSASSPWSSWMTSYGVNITSIAFKNIIVPHMNIGAGVKAITVHNLTMPTRHIKALLLTCTDTTGKPSYVWNYISFPPQKPRNLSCATSDMITVTCTWDSSKKQDPNYHSKQTQTLLIRNSNQAPISCEPSSCSFPVLPQLQEYHIWVLVKNKLGEETESYSFNISDRVFPVLEWEGVIPGVTNVSLSWSVKGKSMQMNLLCQVSTVPESAAELRCNGLCKVRLDNLQPNTRYSTRVRCSVNGMLWGKWTQTVSYTTYPLVTLDLWRRIKLSDSHIRHVTLLWNAHVAGRAETVNVKGYSLQWSQGGQIWTDLKASGQSQAQVSIGPAKCSFTVQAVLDVGSSIPAHVTIPPQEHTETHPLKRLLSTTTAVFFSLSWDAQIIVTCGYTVEWCRMGSVVPCDLQWKKVPNETTTLDLPTEHFTEGRRYAFNIYGCTANGHKLLEIQTGYSEELRSVQSPNLVEPVHSTSSSVTLGWSYNEDDPAQPAFITGYLVTVQEAESEILPGQAANLFNVTVTDPRQKSVTIEGLHENKEYALYVSALTSVGPGLPATVIIRTKISYSAHLTHMTKILTPILLLLGCAILLWPQRKMLKSGLREIFAYPDGMNIKVPEYDSILCETVEKLHSQIVEECISCDIEVLNIRPLLDEATSVRDAQLTNTPCPPCSASSISSTSPCRVPLRRDYHPQSAILLPDKTPAQHTCITNSYLRSVVGNPSEPQPATVSSINSSLEPSDCLQEACVVIYGHISDEA